MKHVVQLMQIMSESSIMKHNEHNTNSHINTSRR